MARTYKTVVERFVLDQCLPSDFKVDSIPVKYSTKGFNIGRFRNCLLLKKSEPETVIYKKLCANREETKTLHVGIKILNTITVNTPKDLLKFVFSMEGKQVTEIWLEGVRYVCIQHSLFVETNLLNMIPVFLATYDSNTYRFGLTIFSTTLMRIKSNLASVITGNLIPLASTSGSRIVIENKNEICKWKRVAVAPSVSFSFIPGLRLNIAKYFEEVWKSGQNS